MKEYKIEIEIDENGNIKAETKGMEGEVCVSELDGILEGLGEISEEKKKPEYYKKQKTTNRVKVGR
jgi:hypothetical protein